jgi:hypothetical protein
MLERQRDDVAGAVGTDLPLLEGLASIWMHTEVAPVMRAQALALVAAAAVGPAVDDVLRAFAGNNSLASAAADAVVHWTDEDDRHQSHIDAAMSVMVLQHAAALLSSLCSADSIAPPSSSFASAAHASLVERLLSPQLLLACMRLLDSSNAAVALQSITILRAFAAATSGNKERILKADAVPALSRLSSSGQYHVRAAALGALSTLLLPPTSAPHAADAAARGPSLNGVAATKSLAQSLMHVLLSAAAAGDVLAAEAMPLLHYFVAELVAVDEFVSR